MVATISSKEIFEEALLDYPGTIILVSHDRYFLNRIPTRIVELSEEGGETFLGAYDYYLEKKSGAIRQIGFSYHGNTDGFLRILNDYDWDMCQVQYNYLDENSQAGRTGVQYAGSKGIPVVIMEPLRGGKLVSNLPEKAKKLFNNYEIKRTPAEWSFKWLWNQKEIMCVLSGMNSLEMVKENTTFADRAEIDSLTDKDKELLKDVVAAINAKMKVIVA